ncbi:MAG TPA: helix-turn-helix domain-containing protein [Micromonosporaceae bacterium]
MTDRGDTGRDDAAVRQFIEHMAMTFAGLGFPRMAARVLFVIMCADEEALTAAQIAERLDISPAAVSGAVRYLLQIQMLRREPVPGSRRDRYRLPSDAWYEVSALKGTLLKVFSEIAGEGVEALGGPATGAGARVAQMRDYFEFVHNEMPTLLDRWEAIKAEKAATDAASAS